MEQRNASIKLRGFGLSGASVDHIWFIFAGALWACLLILLTLSQFFRIPEWVTWSPYLLIAVMFVAHLLSALYTVTLTKETVVLSWLGIRLRRYAVKDLRTFCAVGNGREDVLCLTCHTIEQMALLEEERRLRSWITRHEVPFLKRKPDWQEGLAKMYLDRIRRSPLGILRDSKTLLMPMDPVAQHRLRALYPQLPYRNYTGINGSLSHDRTTVTRLWMLSSEYSVDLREDAIALSTKKEVKWTLSPEDIKTVVRVDHFQSYARHLPHHLPTLFLSVHAPEELAGMAQCPEEDPVLRAYRYAETEARQWSVKTQSHCALDHTAETEARLRTLCGNAQWIDISESWMQNSP